MPMNCRGCGTPEAACIQVGGCCAPCHTNKTMHHKWGSRVTEPVAMTPERLAEIREITENAPPYSILVNGKLAIAARHRRELLEYVDELTRQLSAARRIAIDSGVFQDHRGTEYLAEQCLADEDKWRADPVGPVAWDRQEQQR